MSEGIDVSNTPEELALSVVQTATPPRKPGRPRLENPKQPRRVRKKSEEEIWAENLAALPEEQRAELQALADECWMCNRMMLDCGWSHAGYGTPGDGVRCYPDQAFEAVKAHVKASGGLIEKYATKDKDMEEKRKIYGLQTKLYAQDFRPFCYAVAEYCSKHPEEVDKDTAVEAAMISGWKPRIAPSKCGIANFPDQNRSIQSRDAEEQHREAEKMLRGLTEAEAQYFDPMANLRKRF